LEACLNAMLKSKLNCFASVAKPISNYLTVYENDVPVLPFIDIDLETLRKFLKDPKIQLNELKQ